MHAVKGGWVRQVYALAKCNESAGKKSRIRLSKVERKAMVESFIKKYQKSNNGKFPSISLTHKEVGGSFYVIREIVREIIQENRVLGPAKLTKEEQNIDRFLEQNPLGSISTEPLIDLPLQSNGSPLVTDQHEDASDTSGSDEVSTGSEYKNFDSEQIIIGNLVDVTNGTDGAATVELPVIKPVEGDTSGKELTAATSKVTQITADIVVETFPLQPVAKPTDSIDGRSNEAKELSENLNQAENVKETLSPNNDSSKLDDMNSDVSTLTDKDKNEVEDIVVPIADKKVVENIPDSVLESSDSHKAQNGVALEVVSDNDVLTAKTNEQSQAMVGEAINASNGIKPKVHSSLSGSSGNKSTTMVESKDDDAHANSQKSGNKTLNRINLESWEGTSKSNAGPKTNPIWGKVRSFISAFAKFWSE